jgi:hypothetical protein
MIDAQGLLGVLRACQRMRDRRRAGTTHVARQALTSFWEVPRLPRPLVNGKYPRVWPWSPAARGVLAANPRPPVGGLGLVLEHVRPRNILIDSMILSAHRIEAGELIGYLNRSMAGAVITKAADALLTRAGVAFAPLDQNDGDPWARYRTAGIDPDTFEAVL